MELTVGTIVLSILGWILGLKFLIPFIIKIWNLIRGVKKEIDELNVDASKEILDIKALSLEVYESLINFLMGQIDKLEDQIREHFTLLYLMRKQVLDLNKRLFNKDVVIGRLRELCCASTNCPNRVQCTEENCSDVFIKLDTLN